MTSDVAAQLQRSLYDRVGAVFANTRRGPGYCQVCTAPATGLCDQCRDQRSMYGDRLADLVVPLAYVRGWMNPPHQSFHHMRRYKHPTVPSQRCADDLKLMIVGATALHMRCIERTVGSPWQTLTFVPSASRPGIDHPVVDLTRSVIGYQHRQRLVLSVGPDLATGPERWPLPDRFRVEPHQRHLVADRHIMVVDDTWTSGNKAQSAALALRHAGARTITILCVGRWLSAKWPEHQPLLAQLDKQKPPYDASCCPATGASCPG